MMRLLCALLAVVLPAVFLLVSQSDPVRAASAVAYPQVVQVSCIGGKGTAFKTEAGWVSVAHVTSLFGCSIDGVPIGAEPEDGDFSRVDYKGSALRGFKINCDGMKPGTYVFAVGFAGGYEWQTMSRHLVTYKKADNGHRVLLGSPTVIPGMSGGPILNERGEVVGTVNAYSPAFPVSFSRELKDTSLCRNSASALP